MDLVNYAKIKKVESVLSEKQIKLQQITNKCKQYEGYSDGTETGVTYRIQYTARSDGYDISLVYGNYICSSTTTCVDTPNPDDITVKASIEIGSDIYPVFFNGLDSITIKGGALVKSDEVGIDIKKGTTFYVRTYVSVSSLGKKWVKGIAVWGTDGEGKTTGDITLSGTPTVNTAYTYHPIAIVAKSNSSCVLLIGDSIMYGQGDSPHAGLKENGFGARACSGQIPYVNIAIQTDSLVRFKNKSRNNRIKLANYFKYAISEYGINDVISGTAFATTQANYVALWSDLVSRGLKVYQTTLTPYTTSTDGWVTTANQTVAANESLRVQINDWIRTCPSPLSGYIEIADVAESSRNSGKWRAGYTSDGLHPNATGHANLATGIDTSKFV